MANWQNVAASDELVEMIQNEVSAAFKEATGHAMPEGFSNWSFQKRRGEYIFGIEMDAADKALNKPAAKPSQQGGNIPVHDAEMQLAIREWVECILEGDATLDAVPLVIREAVGRGLQPTNLRPPQKVKEPESLRPPGKGKGEKMTASAPVDNVSRAANVAAIKRDLKRKMSGR